MKAQAVDLSQIKEMRSFGQEFGILAEMINEYESNDRTHVEALCLATCANICMRTVDKLDSGDEMFSIMQILESIQHALKKELDTLSMSVELINKSCEVSELRDLIREKIESTEQ